MPCTEVRVPRCVKSKIFQSLEEHCAHCCRSGGWPSNRARVWGAPETGWQQSIHCVLSQPCAQASQYHQSNGESSLPSHNQIFCNVNVAELFPKRFHKSVVSPYLSRSCVGSHSNIQKKATPSLPRELPASLPPWHDSLRSTFALRMPTLFSVH